jgi:starch phosphorylase
MTTDLSDITTAVKHEHTRIGLSVQSLKRAFIDNLIYEQGQLPSTATALDYYLAIASAIRDRLLQRWVNTVQTYLDDDVRVVAYLSAEYLLGPHLGNNLLGLQIESQTKAAIKELGLDYQQILDEEEEPGLGNGGLGRLAACYMDSLATLEVPAIGYGIRYEYGIFDQIIRDGWQVESTDKWLQWGNPWEIARPESYVQIGFGGHTESYVDDTGHWRKKWVPARILKAVPYDTPILGYKTNTANTLRLWKAEAIESFNLDAFNTGDYFGSVRDKMQSENVSKILYPNDQDLQGKELRLEQQFFFTSASLQDLIRLHLRRGKSLEDFAEKWAIQLNDTHPSISVAELMRLLVDEYRMDWDQAWQITQKTHGYTNHTLLPEALEKWSLSLFSQLLPRHLEIIYEINQRFLDSVAERFPHDQDRRRRMSLIEETGERYVRMAYLATVGSHAINGVAALHTELIKKDLLPDFFEMYPERFSNKTNGITPRRWLALANPRLTALISQRIGDGWIAQLDQLHRLEPFADDPQFRAEWQRVQHAVKDDLVDYIEKKTGTIVDPSSMFDVMVKRIHEYKRQHLKVLHIVALYNRLKHNPAAEVTPRTFLFGGKAAPGYYLAKLIIKLITSVAEVVNNDPDVRGRLRVVFLPDYNVTFGQRVYPSTDLSEQISLAGKEASGTGNMKFAMNGALTVGTLDGANVEIRDAVGPENFFLFGLTVPEVHALKASGYDPQKYYHANEELQGVIEALASGAFSRGDRELFKPILDDIRYHDPYMLSADFEPYLKCQDEIDSAYRDREDWTRKSILNTARMGYFSSDRAVQEYCNEIWKVQPVPVTLSDLSPEREPV